MEPQRASGATGVSIRCPETLDRELLQDSSLSHFVFFLIRRCLTESVTVEASARRWQVRLQVTHAGGGGVSKVGQVPASFQWCNSAKEHNSVSGSASVR